MNRKENWKDWFAVSRKERNGIVLLVLLLSLGLAFRMWVIPRLTRTNPGVLAPVFEEIAVVTRDSLVTTRKVYAKYPRSREYEAHMYPKKRERYPEDSARTATYRASPSMVKPAEKKERIDLNRADSATLLSLPGIGPHFAGKIVKFRTRLGGFHSTDQLYEVRNLPPETARLIIPLIYLDTTGVRKINLNEVKWEELSRHPYLTYAQTKALLAYREKHGPFRNVDEVLNCVVIDSAVFRKIRPYLHAGISGL